MCISITLYFIVKYAFIIMYSKNKTKMFVDGKVDKLCSYLHDASTRLAESVEFDLIVFFFNLKP